MNQKKAKKLRKLATQLLAQGKAVKYKNLKKTYTETPNK